jgi:hypothetical protein
VRDRWIGRRTAVINQLRGFLLEHGITITPGPAHLKRQLTSILEDAGYLLSIRMRTLLMELREEWEKLEEQIEATNRELAQSAKKDDSCQRLLTIPGIGPLTATALTAAIGNGTAFRKAAIWQLGWVWFRDSIQPAVKRGSSVSASEAILIYVDFLSMEVVPCWRVSSVKTTASEAGSTDSKEDHREM